MASLVLSIVGLVTAPCTFGAPAVAAVICGHIGSAQIRRGHRAGHGIALAGMTLGYTVAIPASVLFLLAALGHSLQALGVS